MRRQASALAMKDHQLATGSSHKIVPDHLPEIPITRGRRMVSIRNRAFSVMGITDMNGGRWGIGLRPLMGHQLASISELWSGPRGWSALRNADVV
jgi:hypothetical protein